MIRLLGRFFKKILQPFKTQKAKSVFSNLESPLGGALYPGTFNAFFGWAFAAHGPRIAAVEVVQSGKVLITCEYGQEREDVLKAFSRYPQAGGSGFSGWAFIPEHTPHRIDVVGIDTSGRRHLLASRHFPWRVRAACFLKKPFQRTPDTAVRARARAGSAPLRILIAGQVKTGTTALFFKCSNTLASWPDIAARTTLLFEPTTCSASAADRVLAKVIITPDTPYTLWGNRHKPRLVRFDDFENFSKKILLIRDPRDRLISGLLYSAQQAAFRSNQKALESFIRLLGKKERDPYSVSLSELIRCRLSSGNLRFEAWKDTFCAYNLFFLEFKRTHNDYFNLKYEDFVRGKLGELEAFLGFPLTGNAYIQKTYERVVRTKTSGDWQNWFTEKDINFFRPWFQRFMQELGYEDTWDLPEYPVVLPEHASEYVKRITSTTRARRLTA